MFVSFRRFVFFGLLVLAPSISACQTDGQGGFDLSSLGGSQTGSSDPAPAEPLRRVAIKYYSPFFTRTDHLEDLVEEGNLPDAAILIDELAPYFRENDDEETRPLFAAVARHVNAGIDPRLRDALTALEAVPWPATVSEWPAASQTLSNARQTIAAYPDHEVVRWPAYRSPVLVDLESAVARFETRARNTAPAAFADFDHFGNVGFFNAYPVELEPQAFLGDHLATVHPRLDVAGTADLKRFAALYSDSDIGKDEWRRLGNTFCAAHLRELEAGPDPDLAQVVDAIKAAREAGFEPDAVPAIAITFVEATSRTLLKKGRIEFPVRVDIDLPLAVNTAELDAALGDDECTNDYVIVFDVALARASRRITGNTPIRSKVLVGYRTEANPDYAIAQAELRQTQIELQNAGLRSATAGKGYCEGWGCLGQSLESLGAVIAEGRTRDKVKAAMENLRNTPISVDIPMYEPYRFDKATIKAAKTTTAHYYVIDLRRKTLFKSTFDIEERNEFTVAYGISDEDPNKAGHLASAHSEADVVAWEEAPATVELSQILDHFLAHSAEKRRLPPLATLREEMVRDKNAALAAAAETTFEADTGGDPRFDSVVVVYAMGKGLGSGFYVRPDLVMTNYHVVGENEFVEMKLHDGRETFGKVVARDVRLDLALIRVQARGKPAGFYARRKLSPGSTVEVIGHPQGYEFAITRGVVSAIRTIDAPNIRTAKGVLHVQIDAATNNGNSGGPVFLGDKVIAVVSWSRVGKGVENLNFCIHHAEAEAFLKQSLGETS